LKCPECGAELVKKPKGGIYECPNPDCPVVRVRVRGRGKWVDNVIIHYDSTTDRKEASEGRVGGERCQV